MASIPKKLNVLIFPLAIISALFLLDGTYGYRRVLRWFGVPALDQIFTDLKDTIEFSKNYLYGDFPIETYGQLGKAWAPFSLLGTENLLLYGTLMMLVFFACSVLVAPIQKGLWFYSLLLGSYVTFFALERGQPDLILFCLVVLLVKIHSSGYLPRILITLYMALLKFFPLSLITLLWSRDFKKSILVSLVIMIPFGLLLWIERELFIQTIYHQNRMFGGLVWKSFGSAVIFNLLGSASPFQGGFILEHASSLGLISSLLVFWIFGAQSKTLENSSTLNKETFFLFLAGSLLFLSSFALGRNFDYKLIFLLLTIPYLFQELQQSAYPGWLIKTALLAMGLLFWSGLLGGDLLESFRDQNLDNSIGQLTRIYLNGFSLIKELAAWSLFMILCYMTVPLLPTWFSSLLRFKKPLPES